MAVGDEQVSVETTDNLFYQFTINNLTIKTMETKQWHFDKIRLDKIDKFRHLDKNLDPDFAFFSGLTLCLFTTSWFQDLDFKIGPKFNGLSWAAGIEDHVIHICCVIITYTEISIFLHTDNSQSIGYNYPMNERKKHTKKWGHPLRWLVIGDSSKSVYKAYELLN